MHRGGTSRFRVWIIPKESPPASGLECNMCYKDGDAHDDDDDNDDDDDDNDDDDDDGDGDGDDDALLSLRTPWCNPLKIWPAHTTDVSGPASHHMHDG